MGIGRWAKLQRLSRQHPFLADGRSPFNAVSALMLKIRGLSHARKALESALEEGVSRPWCLPAPFIGERLVPEWPRGCGQLPWTCGSWWKAGSVLVSADPPHSSDLTFALLILVNLTSWVMREKAVGDSLGVMP